MNPWLYGAILLGLLLLKYRYIWSPRDTSILFRGRGKPLFVGHRGALFRGPENTLSAYRAALDAGLEALELDVVSTRDGEVVCSHNFDLERESDATGFINQITWDELQQVQTGVRHKERYPGGVKFDRLVDVIDALPENVLLNIEIKTDGVLDFGTARRVARIVRDKKLHHRCLVSSFNPFAIGWVKLIDRTIFTGFILETMDYFDALNWVHPDCLHPAAELVTDDLLRFARERHLPVNVWTVNTRPAMDWLIAHSVKSIITDRPEYQDGIPLTYQDRSHVKA